MSASSLPVVKVGSVEFNGVQPVFILGPCVMESEEFLRSTAPQVVQIARNAGVQVILKASYDKANRTSVGSYRGPGVKEGCALLAELGRELQVPVTTDVHSPEEAEIAAEYIDLLQIPAFLCRQTDLVLTAAKTGRAVNVKKGQFLAPWDVKPIAEKIASVGNSNFLFTERGTTFGYNNLVADMRSLYWMREQGFRVIFDATHSVQRPGGLGGSTGGDGKLAPVLARAAVAVGVDGVFMETHPHPEKALSDGPNQVPLGDLGHVLKNLLAIHQSLNQVTA